MKITAVMTERKAQILLAGKRGCTQTHLFRSFHYLSFGNYRHELLAPTYALHVVNEDTLASGETKRYTFAADTTVVLIPLVGTCGYQDNKGTRGVTEPGQMQLLLARKGFELEFSNPYREALVNYLCLGITHEGDRSDGETLSLRMDENRNRLVKQFDLENTSLWMGTFDGREGATAVIPTGAMAFCLVVEGVMEVQKRLLHQRDGLLLWKEEEVEFEALSNEAILLLLTTRP